MNNRTLLNDTFSRNTRSRRVWGSDNTNQDGAVLIVSLPGLRTIEKFLYHHPYVQNHSYKERFVPLMGRFTKLKDDSIVSMFEEPAGTMIQYPDGTKRFISESWYEPSDDRSIDWSDEMAEHLLVVYAHEHYIIIREEIRISGAVIPTSNVMDLESIPFPTLLNMEYGSK